MRRAWPAWLLGVGLMALWEVAARVSQIDPIILPTPSAIGQELLRFDLVLWQDAGTTLLEAVIGLAVALLLGVLLGTLVALWNPAKRAVYPMILATQTIPVIALAPLLLIWAGPGIWSKVWVVALWCFFPICVAFADGLLKCDDEIIRMLRSLGASRRQVYLIAQAPGALGSLFTGLKMSAVIAVAGAVVGEWIGGAEGLGHYVRICLAQFHTVEAFSAIVVLSLMGIGLFKMTEWTEWLCRPELRVRIAIMEEK